MHVYAPAPSIERVIAKIHATILNCRNSMRRVLRRPCHTVRFLDCARNDRVGKSTVRRLLSFRLFAFCHFDRSIVFSLAFAQNRGFCAKEERQRSEVARRVYAACLERSLPRRARGEIRHEVPTKGGDLILPRAPLLKIPCSSLLKGAYTTASRSRRKARLAVKLFTSPASRRRRL